MRPSIRSFSSSAEQIQRKTKSKKTKSDEASSPLVTNVTNSDEQTQEAEPQVELREKKKQHHKFRFSYEKRDSKRLSQKTAAPLQQINNPIPNQEILEQVQHLKLSVSELRSLLEDERAKSDIFGDYKGKSWAELVTLHINLRVKIEDLEDELKDLRRGKKRERSSIPSL